MGTNRPKGIVVYVKTPRIAPLGRRAWLRVFVEADGRGASWSIVEVERAPGDWESCDAFASAQPQAFEDLMTHACLWMDGEVDRICREAEARS